MTLLLGWFLFGAAALCGVGAWWTDRALQLYRHPEFPTSSYTLIPTRIREELYLKEAHPLVRRAWRLIAMMYGFGLVGMLLIGLSS